LKSNKRSLRLIQQHRHGRSALRVASMAANKEAAG
jgi:hypothetical protein